ncbi:MAG TPA: hypothetical protein VGI74_08905 [Streptosporangiaceae bacterium]
MQKRPMCHTRPVRNIALGSLTAVAAFAVSVFATGAAFASTPGSAELVPSAGTVPSGLTSLDHGSLPVTASRPALGGGGLTGAASGLGLLSALPLVGSLASGAAPAITHRSAPAAKPAGHAGKAQAQARNTVGSTGSSSPVTGGVSGPSGALPNVGGITGLLKGLPLTSLLGSVK